MEEAVNGLPSPSRKAAAPSSHQSPSPDITVIPPDTNSPSTSSSTFPSTSTATLLSPTPSTPSTPCSPHGLTRLRSLPFPNRLLNALPAYLQPTASTAPIQPPHIHRWLRLPYTILSHMTPASSFADPLSLDPLSDAANPPEQQSLVERIQQEKMKQEVQAALQQSKDLASGESNLLGKGGTSTGVVPSPVVTGGRRGRAMSLPYTSAPLTLQHATLSSVLAAHQPSSRHKVSFSSLIHSLPQPNLGGFNARRRRSRSMSFSSPTSPHSRQHSPHSTSHSSRRSSLAIPRTPSHSRTPPTYSNLPRRLLNRFLHLCRELLFLLHLTAVLISQLGLFGRWTMMALRLLAFAAVLTQAWARIGYAVFFDRRIEHSIQYGPFNRNFLDIYLPTKQPGSVLSPVRNSHAAAPTSQQLHPVFIYVTGGAWIIGYKAWGALLGLLMRAHDCVVVSVDYRNFPQGTIEDMVVDVEQALRWIYDNIDEYGGDREKMFLAGQSAGAHITSLVLLRNAKREAEGMFEQEMKEEEEEEEELLSLREAQKIVEEATELVDIAREQLEAEEEQEQLQQQRQEGQAEPSAAVPPAVEEIKEEAARRARKASSTLDNNGKHRPPALDAGAMDSGPSISTSPTSSSSTASPSPSPTALLEVRSALRTGFPVSRFRGYIGISGIYELSRRVLNHLHASGLPGGTVCAIMGGMEHLPAVSPIRMIRQPEYMRVEVTSLLPPMLLIHGSGDRSVPLSVASEYGQALAAAGVRVKFRCYIGATHTDPIIEHPLRGCYHLTNDLNDLIQATCAGIDERGERGERGVGGKGGRRGNGHGGGGEEKQERGGVRKPAKVGKMMKLPALEFEVNGETMVNACAVRIGRRMNPF